MHRAWRWCGVLPDGTYLSILIDPKVRGARRERLVETDRAELAAEVTRREG